MPNEQLKTQNELFVFAVVLFIIYNLPENLGGKHFSEFFIISCTLILTAALFIYYTLSGKYKLQRALNTINKQKTLQSIIMESTGNGFILFDNEKNIILTNDTFFKMFGLPEKSKILKKIQR